MIAFVSIFLGLVFGVQQVELAVGEGVVAVELRLDGEVVEVLRGAPWTATVDFGEPAPRHFEAVALDAAGREVARTSQWLNLPRPRAVIDVVVDRPETPGGARTARVSWESAAGAEPKAVTVELDGAPLAVSDPRRIALPPVDESQLHLLHVEMRFEGWVSSRVDVTFGGEYVDEVSTELTALPLVATSSKRPPSVAEAKEWFRDESGKALRVIAIEKETAEVVVVMDRAFPYFIEPGAPYKVPKALELARDVQVRFLTTSPEASEGVSTTFDLFPISPSYGGDSGDLYGMLTHIVRPPQERQARPTAAVAVAGLAAYEGRHRRAVVLVPGGPPAADDGLTPVQVRRYLELLRVPLVVWSPEKKPDAKLAAWGEVRAVGSMKELAAAFTELEERLARQWIVWLDGRLLPQDVTLSPAAEGFALLSP